MVRRYVLLVTVASMLAVSIPCKADSPWHDIKTFVQTNPYYRHGLTVATGIYSFFILNQLLEKNKSNLDSKAQLGLSFGGSFVISKVAQENPGYTTLLAVALIVYNLLK